jgi:hypothetical protein
LGKTEAISVCDFSKARRGFLVKRSPHWYTLHPKSERVQIGIITELDFYEDEIGHVICYPVVHWEGGLNSASVHPANVIPLRNRDSLPMRIMIDAR